jgi:protoporphyrin/coproporphyrin ferrochelatase
MPPIGVLMMAYGGPDNLEDVQPYLMDVRGYRPTRPELIAEVRERYRAIGGRSPILEQTQSQATALQAALNAPEKRFRVYVGMRHWRPFIASALALMASDGVMQAVGLVMAPHYSRLSVGAYYAKVAEASAPLHIAPIERWHLLPGYLDALAEHVRQALQKFPEAVRSKVPVIFTAHSLPERILTWADPYPNELHATVAALVERLGSQPATFAYQSAALTPDPWLGPDAVTVIERLAAEGHRHVLIAPIGFVCEHVEILYDVDIVFKRQAEAAGMQLERIDMLGTDPTLVAGLAALVRGKAREAGWQ